MFFLYCLKGKKLRVEMFFNERVLMGFFLVKIYKLDLDVIVVSFLKYNNFFLCDFF